MQSIVSQISWHRMFELQLAYWRGGAKVRMNPFDILTLFGCFRSRNIIWIPAMPCSKKAKRITTLSKSESIEIIQ